VYPIEINGLCRAYKEFTEDTMFCSIGSSKSNIGHLESAAGIAGLTKILLQMKYKMLVPSIHTKELNPNINFNESPFYVQRELEEWTKPIIMENGIKREYPRRAGVSSFGAGGSNSHIILEEYEHISQNNTTNKEEYIIILSAKNIERLKVYAANFIQFLDKHGNDICLRDLAYTLQVGREALEERLAIVTNSIEQLRNRLFDFCNKKFTSDLIYQSNIKNHNDKVKLFDYGNAFKEVINDLINKSELNRVASLWVLGVNIEWDLLYEFSRPNRISLPTYPFARERYWIIEDSEQLISPYNNTKKIHPLIDRNISNFREQKFISNLIVDEFYLADHVIDGKKLLPGVACLEMARVAGEIAGERKVRSIKETVWLRPISVEENCEIVIKLYLKEDNIADYVITSMKHNNTLYAQGSIYYEDLKNNNNKINIDLIKDRCPISINSIDYYNKLRNIGFNYGTSFKPVKEIYKNNNEALAHLELPEELLESFNEFILHPTIIDGAIHPVIALMENTDKLYLPFMLGEIEIIKPLVKECYSYVEIVDTNSNLNKFNINIINKLGEVLVRMESFTTKAKKEKVKEDKSDVRILDVFKKLAKGDINVDQVESVL
jgi:polyketide synthase PksN